METPSSTTRITRSQASVCPNNKITNTIPVSRKIEDSEKILSKSKGQQQDRSALMDLTNDSPIVGLANGGNVETPSAKTRGSRVKNTPGSGEALLRGQVKTLLQKVEEDAMEIVDPTPQMQNLFGNGTDGLDSVTPSVLLQQQQPVFQVENDVFDGKCEITKSLLMDFSDKSQVSDASKECTSGLSYQEVTQVSGVGSNILDDDASVWSMQVNTSTNDEDDEEEEIAEEDEEDYYEDFEEEEEEEYEGDLLLDELCEGLNNIKVNERVVPKFAGKHTRFVYNSDDEIVKEEEDKENCIESDTAESTNILRLKGLPTPEGKHLRFSQEEEGESAL